MKKRLIPALLLLFVPQLMAYTTFTVRYGGDGDDRAYDVLQLSDGGYVFVGETESSGSGQLDLWAVRTDSLGNVLWGVTAGGGYDDCGYSIAPSSDGGFVVAGKTASFGSGYDDVFIVKLSSDGQILWERVYGGESYDEARSIKALPDGGYIVAGRTKSFGAGYYDVYVLRLDENGDTLWTRTFGGDNNDEAYCVEPTDDGGYVVAGKTASIGSPGSNVLLLKISSSGVGEWMEAYGNINWDEGYSVAQTEDEGFLVAGKTLSSETGSFDIYLVRTDSEGDSLWARTIGESGDDEAWCLRSIGEGNYILTGASRAGEDFQVVLYRLDSAGNTVWSRDYGGPLDDGGFSVVETADGGFIIAGKSARNGGGDDAYLVKTDPEGIVEVEEGLLPSRLSPRRLIAIPNPFWGSCLLSPEGPLFRIYDLGGKLVYKGYGPQVGEGLKPGVYFVKASGYAPLMITKLR